MIGRLVELDWIVDGIYGLKDSAWVIGESWVFRLRFVDWRKGESVGRCAWVTGGIPCVYA